MWDGLHVLGVFGAGPASLLLCHTKTAECLDLRGTTEVWIPTVSTEEQHIPNQSLCAPKALCHVHCHGVMTTAATESALYLVDWGPHRYKAFHLPLRVDTTHKYHAPMLCGMVFMFWVCLGQDQHHSCCAIQAPRNV